MSTITEIQEALAVTREKLKKLEAEEKRILNDAQFTNEIQALEAASVAPPQTFEINLKIKGKLSVETSSGLPQVRIDTTEIFATDFVGFTMPGDHKWEVTLFVNDASIEFRPKGRDHICDLAIPYVWRTLLTPAQRRTLQEFGTQSWSKKQLLAAVWKQHQAKRTALPKEIQEQLDQLPGSRAKLVKPSKQPRKTK